MARGHGSCGVATLHKFLDYLIFAAARICIRIAAVARLFGQKVEAVAVQKMILDDRAAYRENSVKPALADYDVFAPVDELEQNVYDSEHSKGFSFSVSSPFVKVSFQVGK